MKQTLEVKPGDQQGRVGDIEAQGRSGQLDGATEGGAEWLKGASGGRAEELNGVLREAESWRLGGTSDRRRRHKVVWNQCRGWRLDAGGTSGNEGDLRMGGTRSDKGDLRLGGFSRGGRAWDRSGTSESSNPDGTSIHPSFAPIQ